MRAQQAFLKKPKMEKSSLSRKELGVGIWAHLYMLYRNLTDSFKISESSYLSNIVRQWL